MGLCSIVLHECYQLLEWAGPQTACIMSIILYRLCFHFRSLPRPQNLDIALQPQRLAPQWTDNGANDAHEAGPECSAEA